MKKIVLLFLVTTVPFTIVMSILNRSIETGLISGLFFGITMTVILGLLDFALSKKNGNEITNSVVQMSEIQLSLSFDDTFELCKKSVSKINGEITIEDKRNGRIQAKTRVNILTWGDIVKFELIEIDQGITRVKIESRPKVRMTVIDYGKNLENVQSIVRYLKVQ